MYIAGLSVSVSANNQGVKTLTALLVSVILGTASAAQNVGAIAALGVGGYVALAGLWAAPVSGVSMNPARSFGPAAARAMTGAALTSRNDEPSASSLATGGAGGGS